MSDRVKNNIQVGKAYYQAMTDAAGYPNGMPYWSEMPAMDQYYHTATAIHLLEILEDEGLITLKEDIGLKGGWGEGDCKALFDALTEALPAEKAELDRRIDTINKAYKKRGSKPA